MAMLAWVGCSQETTEEPFVATDNCDCLGKAQVVVKDAAARITATRYLLLQDVDNTKVAYSNLMPCDTTKLAGLPASKDGEYGYVVSGNLRPPCVANGVTYFWSIELTSVAKK